MKNADTHSKKFLVKPKKFKQVSQPDCVTDIVLQKYDLKTRNIISEIGFLLSRGEVLV